MLVSQDIIFNSLARHIKFFNSLARLINTKKPLKKEKNLFVKSSE